jgi:hypothetical protein
MGMQVSPAPEPRDVVWHNVARPQVPRRIDLVVRKYQWYIGGILVGILREYILDIKGIFVGYQGNING